MSLWSKLLDNKGVALAIGALTIGSAVIWYSIFYQGLINNIVSKDNYKLLNFIDKKKLKKK
jgi:hypothetical protein